MIYRLDKLNENIMCHVTTVLQNLNNFNLANYTKKGQKKRKILLKSGVYLTVNILPSSKALGNLI